MKKNEVNFQIAIGALKEVVLELHRSAADLDQVISLIEIEANNNPEYLKMLVESQKQYIEGKRKATGRDKIGNTEKELWKKLLAAFETES